MMELTPDERRLIEEGRAKKALETRPVDKRKVLHCTLDSVLHLVQLGYQLDPDDGIWMRLRQVLGNAGFNV
jgi:hypothetical protein